MCKIVLPVLKNIFSLSLKQGEASESFKVYKAVSLYVACMSLYVSVFDWVYVFG